MNEVSIMMGTAISIFCTLAASISLWALCKVIFQKNKYAHDIERKNDEPL